MRRSGSSHAGSYASSYIPRAGDIVWLDFDPQAGREQAKRRPALVVTEQSYNRASGLVIVCPPYEPAETVSICVARECRQG